MINSEDNNQMLKYANDLRKLYEEVNRENEVIKEQKKQLEESFNDLIYMGIDMISLYDELLAGHCKRVSNYSILIANTLEIDDEEIEKIRIGALLHDIGLVGIPKNSLYLLETNSEKSEELKEMYYNHPKVEIRPLMKNKFNKIFEIIKTHHEFSDGSGFPAGLTEDQIPLGGKIVGIASQYDVLRQIKFVGKSSKTIIQYMKDKYEGKYSFEIFRIFEDLVCDNDPYKSTIDISISELEVGMTLAKNIETIKKIKLVSAETILGKDIIDKIKEISKRVSIKLPIKIYKS